MNKAKLKGAIVAHGDTQTDLAKALGLSLASLSLRINGHGRGFLQSEMDAIKRRYDLTADQMDEIFFGSDLS